MENRTQRRKNKISDIRLPFPTSESRWKKGRKPFSDPKKNHKKLLDVFEWYHVEVPFPMRNAVQYVLIGALNCRLKLKKDKEGYRFRSNISKEVSNAQFDTLRRKMIQSDQLTDREFDIPHDYDGKNDYVIVIGPNGKRFKDNIDIPLPFPEPKDVLPRTPGKKRLRNINLGRIKALLRWYYHSVPRSIRNNFKFLLKMVINVWENENEEVDENELNKEFEWKMAKLIRSGDWHPAPEVIEYYQDKYGENESQYSESQYSSESEEF